MKLEKIKFKDRDDWLELRRLGIGGSDAAILAGDNNYSTPYTLWLDKIGKLPQQKANEAMKQGTELEEYVAQRFCELTGKKVHRVNFILKNPKYNFALANVDRMVTGENAGLECKTMSPYRFKNLEDGEYPVEYYAQCQHYMAVTGSEKWYLAILVFGTVFNVYEIKRDEEYIKDLMEFEKEFWEENVLKEVPPAVDGQKPTDKGLNIYYNSPETDSKKQLTNKDKLINKLLNLKDQKAEIETSIRQIEQELKSELGNYEIAESDNYRVTWKPQTRKTFKYKEFIEDHPEFDYAPYYKETTSRTFKVYKF